MWYTIIERRINDKINAIERDHRVGMGCDILLFWNINKMLKIICCNVSYKLCIIWKEQLLYIDVYKINFFCVRPSM